MIYLASPYSHPDLAVRNQRFEAACVATTQLLQAGRTVFSPIVYGHALVKFGLPTSWTFWEPFDRALIGRSDEVLILTLDGWRESVGVQAEIEVAGEMGIPVSFLAPRYRRRSRPWRSEG